MQPGKNSFQIMTISGIPIKLDISWLVIFALVTWTFATIHFPGYINDNSSLMRVGSISDWSQFLQDLQKRTDPVKQRIWKLMDSRSTRAIETWQSGTVLQQKVKNHIINNFNDILRDRDFYTEEAFAGMHLNDETKRLIKKGTDNISYPKVRKLNLMLLQTEFPGMINSDNKSFPPWMVWILSAFSAILLFGSILLHEMSHSLVAQKTGLPIKEITLFIFGGVAQMTDEPSDPKQEFFIAIAGPAMSLLLGILFGAAYLAIKYYYGISVFAFMFQHLMLMNILMIVFNMVPGLPLDGGRVLRAILWGFTGDLQKSTKISSSLGKGFGLLLAIFGGLSFIGGQTVGGIWFVIIGLFLYNAAKMSMDSVQISGYLEGILIKDAMIPNPAVVPAEITLRELAERYFMTRPHRGYIVVEEEKEADDGGGDGDRGRRLETEDSSFHQMEKTMGYPEDDTSGPEGIMTITIDEGIIHQEKQSDNQQSGYNTRIKYCGFVSLRDLLSIKQHLWSEITVGELIKTNSSTDRTIDIKASLKDALKKLMYEDHSFLVVVENDELKGILTHRNIMNLVTIRASLVNSSVN